MIMVSVMFKPAFRRCFGLLVLPGVLAGLAACHKSGDTESKSAKSSAPIPVTVSAAAVQTVPYLVTAIGNVEPLASIAVKSRVDGQITEVFIADGQDVARGELMFQIDPRPFQIQAQQAEAALARDRALLEAAQAQEARYRDLLTKNYISQDGYTQVKSNMEVAAAAVKSDEGSLANARLQLEFTRIVAPINGRIGKVGLTRGNLVKANDANPLVTLNQINPIYVSFSVPEQALPGIRDAMKEDGALPIQATTQDHRMAEESGLLSFIDNAVDATTGTIRLRGTFRNGKHALWPGQFVSVRLQLGEQKDALVIPAVAVLTGPKGPYVYVVSKEQTVAMREIKVARTVADSVVVEQGLVPGDRVVVDGQSRLTPGATISARAAGAAQ